MDHQPQLLSFGGNPITQENSQAAAAATETLNHFLFTNTICNHSWLSKSSATKDAPNPPNTTLVWRFKMINLKSISPIKSLESHDVWANVNNVLEKCRSRGEIAAFFNDENSLSFYLFDPIGSSDARKTVQWELPRIPAELLLPSSSWTEGFLDLSDPPKVVPDIHNISLQQQEKEKNRTLIMTVLIEALFNWFEGILTLRGWIRVGYLFIWDGDDDAELTDNEGWKDILFEHASSLSKRGKGNAPSNSSSTNAKTDNIRDPKKLSQPFAIDLGISLCFGIGLLLNPVQREFPYETLSPKHFSDGVGPGIVLAAPNGIEATLIAPNDTYMDRMNILFAGTKMPVSFSSRNLFVPLSNSTSYSKNQNMLDWNRDWHQIDESATICTIPEPVESKQSTSVPNTTHSKASSMEKTGSHNSKKEGKISSSRKTSTEKSPPNTSTASISDVKRQSMELKAATLPVGGSTLTNNSDLDINANLPIDASFNSQNFGALALDMVDDDDFDFFESKTNSAGDSVAQNTVNAESSNTPAAFEGSIMGQSPPPGATPYADPSTPFVFSPPPVIMQESTSPGAAIHHMYITTPDHLHQAFSPPNHKSTPVTPFTFSQSPNTPAGYDAFHGYSPQITPMVIEAKVRPHDQGQEVAGGNGKRYKTCSASWLPFDITSDVLFGKSSYGVDRKWFWAPQATGVKKSAKFNLQHFMKKRITKRRRNEGEVTIRKGYYPLLTSVEARFMFPFSLNLHSTYGKETPVLYSLFFENSSENIHKHEWARMALYECARQIQKHHSSLFQSEQNANDLISKNLWDSIRDISNRLNTLPDANYTQTNVCSDPIQLAEYLKVEDDEESNFAIYGTIKLRRKKSKQDTVVEVLSPPQIVVSHNSSQIVCSPQILRVWTKCRIEPLSGPKVVTWLALYPDSPSLIISQRTPSFMSQLEAVWDLLGFGKLIACQLPGESESGFVKASISHNATRENLISSYYSKLPLIAGAIIEQSLMTGRQCLFSIWNPFPNISSSIQFDLCCLYVRLVYLIESSTSYTRQTILSHIHFEIRYPHDIISNTNRDNDYRISLENLCFSIFNSLKKVLDHNVAIHAPAFAIENKQIEPKFSLEIPQLSAPFLLFEPDRIIYLYYGSTGRYLYAIWSDIFGEFRTDHWSLKPSSDEEIVEYLLDYTFSVIGVGGFIPRLVVCCVNGWTTKALTAWKNGINSHADLLKGSSAEEADSDKTGDDSNAPTPSGSCMETTTAKIFPSTPGSAYTTPQADRQKKDIHEVPKAVPILGSLSLVSTSYSRLGVVNEFPVPPCEPESWISFDKAVLFTPCNRVIPWSLGEHPSMAKSWIFQQRKEQGDDCKGVEASLLWHWQADYSTTCFKSWYESGIGKRSHIIKDITRGLYQQRIVNDRNYWIFEQVLDQINIMSSIE